MDAVDGDGGGVSVLGNLGMTYATIASNYASGSGGGAIVKGSMINISSSTISSNIAHGMGGLYFYNNLGTAEITNSTISGNEATLLVGALYARGDLRLTNSTVAFNHDHYANYAAVSAGGPSLFLESSIIAGNGGSGGPADVWADATTSVSGSNNLIVAGSGVSALTNTITDCPRLDPLADNGGATLTHAINPMSPAIDAGSALPSLLFDQTGYARVEGAAADIGAFEWRSGTGMDRIWAGGFDGLCDQ
jgi:WD40 repeat protein